jgi:maleate isomerase
LNNINVALSPGQTSLESPENRKKIGLITLSTDLTTERDFARIIPLDKTGIYGTRVEFANPTTPDNLRRMAPQITAAADLILPGEPLDAICYSCTAASIVIGDAEIAASIHTVRPNVPVVTPSGAAINAFGAFGVSKISILTPYLVKTSLPMAHYFEQHGLQIACFHCLGLDDDRNMARVNLDTILQATLETDTAQTEAFFLSCTAMQAVDVIETIEQKTGKPVVTSNQASAWALMCHAGLEQHSQKWGQLFQHGLPETAQSVTT